MKKLTILLFVLLLSSCATPTPTPVSVGPVDIAGTMVQYQVAAGATSNAVSIQMSATAQVIGATSTQFAYATQAAVTEQARMDAVATSDQARQDAQATQARMDFEATQAQARRDAVATSEQARLDVQSTTTAEKMALEFAITQTAIPPANTMTAVANEQAIRLAENQVEKSNLEVEQQRQKNSVEWVTPYLIALVATMVGAIFVIRYSRVREVKNEDGEVEVILIEDKAIRPRLMPTAVITLDADGARAEHLTNPAEQSEVTRRAQAVEALKNMPVNPSSNGAEAFNRYFQPAPTAGDLPFDVIEAGETPSETMLNDETLQTLRGDWKEARDA